MAFSCKKCERVFSRKDNLKRHMDNKTRPCIKAELILKLENEILKEKYEIVIKENHELKENEINIINKNSINTINNLNNNNINITNNYNIVKIIDHGKENYNNIDIKKIIKENKLLPELNYISTIIYNIHCNDDFPEYQNIFIPDKNRDKATVYRDGKWSNVDKDTTMDKLFNNVINYYDEIVENEENKNLKNYINYNNEIKKIIPQSNFYSKKNRKGVINNAEGLLYDNKEKIKSIKIKKEEKIEIIPKIKN
jgi:hypothetical protein